MSHSVGLLGMQAIVVLALLPLAAQSAPVHVVLPDVVTLENGHAITLYSPPHHNSYSAESSEALISVDQAMLLHALAATPDVTPLPSAYDHSKHFAQLSPTSSFDAHTTLSTKTHSDIAADLAHTHTTELSIVTEFESTDSVHTMPHSPSSSAVFALTLPATRHKTSSTFSSFSSDTSTETSASRSSTPSSAATTSSSSGLDALFSFLATSTSSDPPKAALSSEQLTRTTTGTSALSGEATTFPIEPSLSTTKSTSSAVTASSTLAFQSSSTMSSLFSWLSQASSSSLTSTTTSIAESSSSVPASNSLESSTGLDSLSQSQGLLYSSPTSITTSTTLPSNSKLLSTLSSTISPMLSTNANSEDITPLAWTSLGSASSLQVIGSLAMLYPFTTHIPLLAASPTQSPYDLSSTSIGRTDPVSAIALSTLASTSHSSMLSLDHPSKTIPLTGPLSSPLTLHSGDFIEMVVSHIPVPTTMPDSQNSTASETHSSSEMHGWTSLPVDIERLELPVAPNMSQTVLKRSFNSDASSLTAELLSEAAESARSLLSVMRNIATHSEYDQPAHHGTSTHIRDNQFVYPEEDPAAPTLYKGSPAPEYHTVVYPPSTLTTTTTLTPDCTTAITTTTLDHTTTTTLLSTTSFSPSITITTTTITESNASPCFTGFPSIPINVVVTLVQPTI